MAPYGWKKRMRIQFYCSSSWGVLLNVTAAWISIHKGINDLTSSGANAILKAQITRHISHYREMYSAVLLLATSLYLRAEGHHIRVRGAYTA